MADIKKLESELWEAADNLRANSKLTSQQYCMPVLGLIFLRYAFGRFKRVDAEIKAERAQVTGRQIPIEPSDYTQRGAMYLPENARYDYLLNLPESADLGKEVNDAMKALEKDNATLAGVLPKTYDDLEKDLIAETLRIFNHPALDEEGDDIIGRIYEYFLSKFAPAVASDDGVFFTPKSLVRLIMNIIEPKEGTMLDPACGSGGMFVSASDYVREEGGNPTETMTFYGQEKVEYNAQLCKMNMAVHGLNGSILSGNDANTFYHDAHSLDGKCNYVAANPPFNVDKVKSEEALAAGRLPLGNPRINDKKKEFSNGNYLWINYFYSYLNKTGRAGFVMASSATDSNGEKHIRRELVEKKQAVDVMLYVGNNFFYTKSLPCTLWFFDKNKSEAIKDKVLFIDAQRYHTAVSTTLNEWTPWQLKNLTAIVWLYRGELEKYKALIREYKARCYELSALFEGEAAELLAKVSAASDFAPAHEAMLAAIEKQKADAKAEVEAITKAREKKQRRETLAELTTELEAAAVEVSEACWLTEKFGDGVYADVSGLCKIATANEIKGDEPAEKSSWSLTPGAYVGVPPVEDDGVDFHERMGEIQEELTRLQAESNELMAQISANFKELGL